MPRVRSRRWKAPPRHCSFCGNGPQGVDKLIAGPGVWICDECVRLCNEILEQE